MRNAVLILVACSKTDPLPPPPPEKHPEPPPAVKMTPPDPGACNLVANGAFSGKELALPIAAGSKHWNPDEQAGFRLDCTGKDLRVSVVTKPDTSVPFNAKDYDASELVILGRAGTNQLADFTGTVKLVQFDTKQLSGMIVLVGKQRGGGKVKLEGDFIANRH